ncbi:MAG TPA: cell division protein FtsL [Steroidobacteraceae bacterium]|nr:cell division protein FtsL [Steroidobacteraceae bacterium]
MSARLLALAVAALWTAVLASAAAVVYVKHEARTLFVELEKLSSERDRLNIEWGRLQLEQSAWSAHGFVEQVANRQLRMTLPSATEVKIVQP